MEDTWSPGMWWGHPATISLACNYLFIKGLALWLLASPSITMPPPQLCPACRRHPEWFTLQTEREGVGGTFKALGLAQGMEDSGTGEDKGSFPKCQCGEEKNWGNCEEPLPWGNKWGAFFLQYSGEENTQEFPEPLVRRWRFGTSVLLEEYRMGKQHQSTWGRMSHVCSLRRLQTAPTHTCQCKGTLQP